ncbi:Cof-type HAD-IIB family hydrolase [Streptobacillus moniliformis]|uniref:Cof-like hydrolase n=1 Tax=Streptobacillus moniliformis (strain ATCC 14647 / DSM 12112 / NCTC 10651 / 9901) TaxID=519441 RepID=D1AY88_STRM9|nr:Cof-type HAD-IIB family hydrolase [Streptobacillus moniliformis]ACZ01264.1 Cof-like hydrolase [Streptobacillus moniliformis DSM 12112]AVL42379.1 Cof-type HAD-IIB family hydrolase [Streptobacillus moniliformis]QXW66006.1 Cof-type HAD-IIB family hydrolase [Streptobacillus moniliformis]SQA13579.1 Putative hydrolase M6_Spy0533 [Streptobacillus moniliformis]SQA14360.1 Putative hydrolase M6_Spy0533 [Streptobacillus moniliformis]
MIKLIATDMDGTLLNSKHEIAEKNIESIIKAQENGYTFVLASGRPTFAMIDFAKELKMDKFGGYIISFNGGEIIDCKTWKKIYSLGIEKNEILEMYNYAKENNLSFLLYDEKSIFANEINEYTIVEADITNGEIKLIEDIEKMNLGNSIKCMLLSEPENLIKHEKILKESKFSERLFFARSLPIFLEVVNKNIDKGKTLHKLLEILNFDKNSAIGVGDSYNDIPLLSASAFKVVPSNAKPELKEMADYVGVSNDEGILADLIEKFILIK